MTRDTGEHTATSPNHAIGAAIRAARFSRGLTQDDLAARLGLTRATVASYETGRRKVPAATLIQIAHLCGTSLGFFDAHQSPAAAAQPAPPAQEAAIQMVVQLLTEHPELTPFVLEFLETLLRERLVERV